MKRIAASISLFVLLVQISNRYMLMLNYELNKNYISKTLCINRNKPMSGCSGKCYLKKQLAKASKEENAPNTNKKFEKNEVLFITVSKKITTYFFAEENSKDYINSRQPSTFKDFYGKVFHPPQVI